MMIRPATPADIPAAVDLAIEALSIDPYPNLVISRERVFAIVRECVSSAAHFAWVSERDGKIVGGLGAQVTDNPFHERKQANVALWYCKHPGDGAKLMREFLGWCYGRPLIRVITYTGERGADPRVGKLVKRCGLDDSLPLYLKVR